MSITNKQIWDELRALGMLIRGDPEDREDLGLLGDVRENSQFRRTAMKVVWLLVVAIIGAWGTIVAQVILNGGN
ncbi:hypothetical protein LCGC14_1909500 [marine sediment metagenome]|uniref:Uncharacterized protein n=1 Tax=marine sediment metagenome TaxID=412755 RepID=A0A0F9I814_9ZZZZ